MNIEYLLVFLGLCVVAGVTYLLTTAIFRFAERRGWGDRAEALISYYTVAILTSCLIGGLGALALSFPGDNRRAAAHPADPPTTM